MNSDRSPALAGLGVLIPRPRREPDKFLQLLLDAGCEAHVASVIDIVPTPCSGELPAVLAASDMVIFVSVNAVELGLAAMSGVGVRWPDIPCFAIGRATAQALAKAGIQAQFPCSRVDSEGLLALPGLNGVHGKRILICRGEGGRDKLAETLRQRGAVVDYADLYRRLPTLRHRDRINQLIATDQVQVVAIHSGAILHAFLACLNSSGKERLASLTFLAPGGRVAALLRAAGLRDVVVAAGALPEQMAESLVDWYTGKISSMG